VILLKALTLKKKIVIPYNGYIALKGVNGPITVPYMETFENISRLLMARMPVQEVLSDGTKIALDLINYDKENSWNASSTEKKYEAVTYSNGKLNSAPNKKKNPIIVTDEDVKAKSVETLLKRPEMKSYAKKPAEGTTVEISKKTDTTINVHEHGQSYNKKNKWKNKSSDEVFDSK
jgi:hypothetical protein